MLKPIHHVPCSPALRACRRLQEHLAAWLCDPAVAAADISQANLVPPRVPTQIEADWLWAFLQKVDAKKSLLARAQTLASLPIADKGLLQQWVNVVSELASQFQSSPPAWPIAPPAISKEAWLAFKELMEAFYEKGLRGGLPYAADGTPVTVGGVTYAQFVQTFRNTHRLNPNPSAREVCVLCGGPLEDIEVDHWIAKSAYPLLSVCADNLLPICATCNSTENKGEKPVHSNGSFADWFHPYWRHADGDIRLDYDLRTLSIVTSATNPDHVAKVANLDQLLNLAKRWTREFKAEYAKQQGVLLRREQRRKDQSQPRHTRAEIVNYIETVKNDLLETEPYYEVHRTMFAVILEQARLAAWETELGLIWHDDVSEQAA